MNAPSIVIGIDNGASGSVGVIGSGITSFFPAPTQPYLHYGKKGTISRRLDRKAFEALLKQEVNLRGGDFDITSNFRTYIERPFSGKFVNSVVPAHRFFEATIIVMEDLELGYEVVDSGPWQNRVLGNVRGSAELKRASLLRGQQLYPQFKAEIAKHGDADGLMIAHHYFYHA